MAYRRTNFTTLAGKMLAHARVKAGLSVKQLADAAAVSESSVVRTEKGHNVSIVLFHAMCEACGVKAGDLLNKAARAK